MKYLVERLTYDQLFRISEPKRIARSATVSGPPLEIDSYQDAQYFAFNFKSSPSTTGLRHKGYVKFLKPKDNKQKPLQHLDCEVDCTCFSGDTRVLMSDGTYKPIAEIKPGDFVYTHLGRVRRVLKNNIRTVEPDESVYRIKVTGFPGEMTVTGEHPFYALRGNQFCSCGCGQTLWNLADSYFAKRHGKPAWLNPKFLLNRRFCHGHNAVAYGPKSVGQVSRPPTDENPFTWIKVDEFRSKEWFLSPWIEPPTKRVQFDPHLARLLGYYAAEGHYVPSKAVKRFTRKSTQVFLTFANSEFETLGKDILNICEKLGYGCKVNRKHAENGFRLVVKSQAFRDLCLRLIGRGSDDKRLSDEIFHWNDEALKNFVTGAILGDGSNDGPGGEIDYSSVNFDLVSQLSTIFNRLKVYNIVCFSGKRKGRKGAGKRSYTLCLTGETSAFVRQWLQSIVPNKFQYVSKIGRRKFRSMTQGQLRAMRYCKKTDYSGLVYDLTVEGDLTYIVNGVAVYDCPDYRYRWAFMNKQRRAGHVGPQSLNQCLNRAPRHTNPGGRSGMCKHLLAAREYIYGLLSSFPSKEPDTADKLDKLTKYAQKRWIDFPGAMAAARERDARMAAARAARRAGVPVPGLPPLPAAKPKPAGPPPPKPGEKIPNEKQVPVPLPAQVPPVQSKKELLAVPPRARGREMPTPLPKQVAPALAKPPAERGRNLPPAAKPAQPTAVPPGERGRNLPAYTPPAKPGQRKPPGPKGPGGRTPRGESVDIMNGKTLNVMNDLLEAQKIINELYDEAEETASNPEEEQALVPVDDTMAEPSDSEMGTDTEGTTALSLLAEIRDFLAQLATALAPPEEGGEGGPGGPGGEGGPMPPEAGGEEMPGESGEEGPPEDDEDEERGEYRGGGGDDEEDEEEGEPEEDEERLPARR